MGLSNSTATQPAQFSDVFSYIDDKDYSNEAVVITTGNLDVGTVIAQLFIASQTHAGNTGNGVLTAANIEYGASAKVGRYILTCIAASTGSGTFKLTTPENETVPQLLTVGTDYSSDHLIIDSTTLTDGSADFIVGDKFLITVTSTYCAELLEDSTNGRQTAYGILAVAADATLAPAYSAAVVRGEVIVNTDGLKWNNTITAAQKNIAIAQMKRNGLVFRNGV